MTKTFSLADILSVTTGYILSDRGVVAVADVFCYMTGEYPESEDHLDKLAAECRPYLYDWFPELNDVKDHVPDLGRLLRLARLIGLNMITRKVINNWIDRVSERVGLPGEYEIPRICDVPMEVE